MKEEKKTVPFEVRPTCSCGAKMKVVKYRGYYDEFVYFRCNNCQLDDRLQDKYEPDKEEGGAYA